ncbi:CbxX/CfqX family protein [Coprinopsis cinerea okayama7|uniref:CbxX/CfqX family protein n=1 Tax=Coprinopsis cinerea (strain Okayama-7 / 130 / ATCC MYA-4618 / FGSC 9003) TaxID=240176 RepID=D6RNW6_COPC7|nr:CbxX/CfqX family protein [Coprinopsis cinerea okayama7\|eukprot:XP_002910884.1 CbxX/CfqX family protein [Coprinopsis cinerea okayama7\
MASSTRVAKLTKIFDTICDGKTAITAYNGPQFIEAIYSHTDPIACLNKLATGKEGKNALQSAIRYKLDTGTLNGSSAALLNFLSNPDFASIGEGQLLRGIVLKIADPPIFWNALQKAFVDGNLNDQGSRAFAWLLFQLVSLPKESSDSYRSDAQLTTILAKLLASDSREVRGYGQQIKNVLATYQDVSKDGVSENLAMAPPGGRHDNDFPDFRSIAITPTPDEIACSDQPFIRPSDALLDPKTEDRRTAIHLDNQFRLLREDLLYELREELKLAESGKLRRANRIDGLEAVDIWFEPDPRRRSKYGIQLKRSKDLPFFKDILPQHRLKHLQDNRNFLKHQSLACLMLGKDIIAFVTINRVEDLLAKEKPVIVVHLEGKEGTLKAFETLRRYQGLTLLQINTALFAYEFVLKALQESRGIPLSEELLFWKDGREPIECDPQATIVVDALKRDLAVDLQPLLKTKHRIVLDPSQARSLLSGLTQRVSLVQGPPGTGKSFLGALLAKSIHDYTKLSMLVVCYTNHALDDILEGLLDVGIPAASMVRLGGKSTPKTEPLSLQKQAPSGYSRDRTEWQVIDEYKQQLADLEGQLDRAFKDYMLTAPGWRDVLDHIEFEDPECFIAFQVPETDNDGMQLVDRRGRAIGQDFLLTRWKSGNDAGFLKGLPNVRETPNVWNMPSEERKRKYQEWVDALQKEKAEALYHIGKTYNETQEHLDRAFAARDINLLRQKRIIGCTTTAAAKYGYSIQTAAPQVVLVEEAGEILESHILTALGRSASQLVLIGDHKQLRPKVNNYELTVEKGNGYDLNRSLFERLILANYPHQTLSKQHRMRPEISNLIRQLTYPELQDDPKTSNRPNITGLQENIVFIDHAHPEESHEQLADRKDMAAPSSKQNKYEVQMVLKIVKYLGQQGDALKKDNDPVLNDLDSHELVRAGLLTPATAKAAKKPLRLATIDNYQGEEADIVIISLTRSNSNGDIGFMYSPERLNVLLSRARNGMIIIGNSATFKKSKKGKELWTKLLDMLVDMNSFHSGLPVYCPRHPDRKQVLETPEQFDEKVPDGGCVEPCSAMLNCNIHKCPSKCHHLSDHSKIKCDMMVPLQCPRGHKLARKCFDTLVPDCKSCKRLDAVLLKKAQDDLKEKERREQEEAKHLEEIAKIDAEIQREKEKRRRQKELEDQENARRQKLADLAALRATSDASSVPTGSAFNPMDEPEKKDPGSSSVNNTSIFGRIANLASSVVSPISTPTSPPPQAQAKSTTTAAPAGGSKDAFKKKNLSPSEAEWDRQKRLEGAINPHIDKIVAMVGLEAVKRQVLAIKAKIDTCERQGTSLSKERFNIVFLGNPGTGKTTVAREYAAFLSYVKVLPGNEFKETSGAKLANEGVSGAEKLVQDVLKNGGGAIFVDEAYQLTSKGNFGGGPVLDYLLTEMENNVGKLVFILAGYTKEMETFFEFNPGLNSRVPYKIKFEDYKDDELMTMLENMVHSTYNGKMKVEDGIRGLYGRVAIRRIGRRRGTKGFGNARELQSFFQLVRERQSVRLNEERKQGQLADDFLLTKEDLIGPDPSIAVKESEAWKKLQALIGLKSVKESVQNLVDSVKENYDRELSEQAPLDFSLNRVFLGPPGTGKTTVAQLYGQILADIGMLSKGEVVLKNPSDFTGTVLGESEDKTKGILNNSVGKVLVIDENVNPGLARRFKIEEAFRFEDFNDQELLHILEKKLKDQDLGATDVGKAVAIESLARARTRPNFGNGGEVENLLSKAKQACLHRRSKLPYDQRPKHIILEPQDFDPDYDRASNATKNLEKLFDDIVGHEEIKAKLAQWQKVALVSKSKGMDPRDQVPTNFVFTGPPGTGKTTIARKMGQVYYDMGLLASTDVFECSASDLVGQYVGQTGPKTRALFDKALGKVLFVDEAYRLAEGHFAQEAVDELVGLLTHETYKGKVIVILAGYDQDMKRLMQSNTGLNSRFPVWVPFQNIHPKDCLAIVVKQLKKRNVVADELFSDQSKTYFDMLSVVDQMSTLPDWGNARDMMELSKVLINKALLSDANDPGVQGNSNQLVLSGNDVVECAQQMLSSRMDRARVQPKQRKGSFFDAPVAHANPTPPTPPSTSTATGTKKASPPPPPPPTQSPARTQTRKRGGKAKGKAPVSPPQSPVASSSTPNNPDSTGDARDPGVSDEIWAELQRAKQAAADRDKQEKAKIADAMRKKAVEEKKKRDAERKAEELARQIAAAEDQARRAELERQRIAAIEKAARLAEEARRIAEQLKREQQAAAERARKEQIAQQKLRTMGVCPANYRWIPTDGGYRCAGGSHFASNAELGL